MYEIILKRRSIRKFLRKKIEAELLENCVNAARLAPSTANRQVLEFIVISENTDDIFSITNWAGYLKDGGPKKGEEPTAYVLIITDKERGKSDTDVGLAAANIIYTALGQEVGSCCIGAFNREKARKILEIPEKYEINLLIALGYPAEQPIAVESNEIKYWRDDVHHVPKRPLGDVIHWNKF